LIVIPTAIENAFHSFLKKIGHLMKRFRKKEDGERLTKKKGSLKGGGMFYLAWPGI
jgi:hypothetical protein